MAEPLPHWQAQFLERHRLPPVYLDSAQKWFAPVGELLAGHQKGARRPLLVGVNGSQGSGKTTLCDYLCDFLSTQHGLSCVALSLDDFYLTRLQRQALAESIHPLLATRGVPGTHDMDLLADTLDQLMGGEPAAVPRFDKATDDRHPPQAWHKLEAPVDIVLLEGWCLGVTAQSSEQLAVPVNDLELREDGAGLWREYVNSVLETRFPPLYARVDEWIMLRAPSFDCVYRWRLEQERKLAAVSSGDGIMSDAEVARFIQFYERLTSWCLAQLPRRVNHLFKLNDAREVSAYLAAPGRHS